MPVARVNDTELFYAKYGEGLPCLVLHGGFGFDHTYLHPWLDPLGDVLHLVYYDHRCHGRSGRPPIKTLTFDQLARDADALRENLGFERVAVLGHSIGGKVALEYALQFPQRLSQLILVDTTPARDHMGEIMANAQRKATNPTIMEALTGPPPITDAEFAHQGKVLAPLYFYNYDPELYDQLFSKMILNVEAIVRNFELDYNFVPRLGEIEVPTLVLVGRDDWNAPPSQASRLHQGIPNSDMVVFEQSGHFPFIEEPEAFFFAIRDWLARKS